MPPKGLHVGGYSEVTAKKMESVELPDKIRCKVCKKVKGIPGFSKKQLSDLRYKVLTFGKISGTQGAYIKCRQCTGTQNTEMKCCICDETKGLDDFAKTQRRNPDAARCRMCVARHLSVEPTKAGDASEEEEEEEEDDDDEGTNTNSYRFGSEDNDQDNSDGGAPVSRLDSMKLAQLESITGSHNPKPVTGSSNGDQASSTVNTGTNAWTVWSNNEASEAGNNGNVWTTQNTREEKQGIPFTGYDSSGVAHSRYRAPSTTASDLTGIEVSRSGFAKVKGPRYDKPQYTAPKSKGYSMPSRDSDDDDDGEDFYTTTAAAWHK